MSFSGLRTTSPFQCFRVLAIDDDPEIRAYYLDLFKKNSHDALDDILSQDTILSEELGSVNSSSTSVPVIDIRVAESGENGLQQIEEAVESGNPFAVLLLDMRIPLGWNGLETARRVRQIDLNVRIFFVTAFSDVTIAEIQSAIGINFSIINKPFKADQIVQNVTSSAFDWHNQCQLDQERYFSASLLEGMADGVYAVDRKGDLVYINQAAQQMLGWHEDELAGKNIHDMIHRQQDGSMLSRAECPVSKALEKSGQYFNNLEWFLTKKGDLFPVQLSSSTIKGANSGSIAVFHDISEKYQMEKKLKHAFEEVQQANRARDAFLAAVSHELRTPLSLIIGNSEFLEVEPLSEIQQQQVSTIGRSGKRLLALVNDLLDHSKLESGKFEIVERHFNLVPLIEEISQIFSAQIEHQGITFIADYNATLTHYLIGDEQRIGQILINLIGNAVKFTREGAVTLRVWHDQQLHFEITDTGIGMEAAVVEQLFQPYQQVAHSTLSRFGGTGLGLYISKALVEQMGGSIEVESKEGVGSRFACHLPLKMSDKPFSISQVETKRVQQSLHGSVLIVEDAPELQLLERRMVEAMGVEVTVANNGEEAVQMAQQSKFDLILMDMQMPVMDGVEATRILVEQECKTPIIALTANVTAAHRAQFIEAGCDGFISKPIQVDRLQEMVVNFLSEKR